MFLQPRKNVIIEFILKDNGNKHNCQAYCCKVSIWVQSKPVLWSSCNLSTINKGWLMRGRHSNLHNPGYSAWSSKENLSWANNSPRYLLRCLVVLQTFCRQVGPVKCIYFGMHLIKRAICSSKKEPSTFFLAACSNRGQFSDHLFKIVYALE